VTGAAPVSVLVSFAAVRERPQGTGPGRSSRSQAALTRRERTPTDLESVLGASPQEFESLILRLEASRHRYGVTKVNSSDEVLDSLRTVVMGPVGHILPPLLPEHGRALPPRRPHHAMKAALPPTQTRAE
jgi:hypothetical protein